MSQQASTNGAKAGCDTSASSQTNVNNKNDKIMQSDEFHNLLSETVRNFLFQPIRLKTCSNPIVANILTKNTWEKKSNIANRKREKGLALESPSRAKRFLEQRLSQK